MDMGGDMPAHVCKISMLWNWYRVDACFISTQWHIRSEVAFAFTVICIFILVALVEGVRRFGREYDRRLIKVHQAKAEPGSGVPFALTWPQQATRATIFGVQFGAAYILMLLAMYYNGYIIFAIILGGTFGHFVFSRDTVNQVAAEGDKGASCC
ncbi:SubName: Full=Related to copper transport protein {ECO:0000313/EMBL:CCA75408.1} [Serendipita indica DSM 11827]|uniref:Copper transport protein n=1 Tax=Serendipita indica (strain DSM 11827) TaxID=1109443 RepID=G4TVR5_SERID|nr:SubName: Full=Related to copper transport protein {ECO:0000313/EMBL:CCA75408.1} [Serendipita indica DSM 11827]CCA75408.1 related to copper transport protein [Serendipita indica DSM 11827]